MNKKSEENPTEKSENKNKYLQSGARGIECTPRRNIPTTSMAIYDVAPSTATTWTSAGPASVGVVKGADAAGDTVDAAVGSDDGACPGT